MIIIEIILSLSVIPLISSSSIGLYFWNNGNCFGNPEIVYVPLTLTCADIYGVGFVVSHDQLYYNCPNSKLFISNECNVISNILSFSNNNMISCVDLDDESFVCNKTHNFKVGNCIKVETNVGIIGSTEDHLVYWLDKWRLFRELQVNEKYGELIIRKKWLDICDHLTSCRTNDKKFIYKNMTFAYNALITPDNYMIMKI